MAVAPVPTEAPLVRTLTLEDYLELPLDGAGVEREIIRGRLVVSPRPNFAPHQFVVANLQDRFRSYARRRKWHLLQVVIDSDLLLDAVNTYVSPDLMVFGPESLPALRDLAERGRRIHVAVARPVLVVEILSPGSERNDLEDKRRDYEAVRIPHYWALDPLRRALHEHVLAPATGLYSVVVHKSNRVRPRLFAGEQPPLVLDLKRLLDVD